MSNDQQVTFFAGINGSGKTTTYMRARTLVPTLRSIYYVNPDEILRKRGGAFLQAAKLALIARNTCIEKRISFVFESTFSGNSEIRTLVEAKNSGFKINGVIVGTENLNLNLQRITERSLSGGHFVPTEDVLRRNLRVGRNYSSILSLSDRLYLVDNSGTCPKIQAIIKEQKIKFLAKNTAKWVLNFLEKIPRETTLER